MSLLVERADAELRRVDPGDYRLLQGVEDIICDTSVTMAMNLLSRH